MYPSVVATLALAASALPALGLVSNVIAPSTGVCGQNISVTLQGQESLTNNLVFGAAWGVKPASLKNCTSCLGYKAGYQDLSKNEKLPFGRNETFQVEIPDLPNGEYYFVTTIPYEVGESGGVQLRTWNQSFTITGDCMN
ncbi:hypothetical protein BD324DRAFT_678850 [Kockovaella imperatae]|uniref:Uncharacterized protein n=1 Tax=Kockovaella imperatae TaxID=4999 RepID=A0A1Y1UNX5_9TREE|nr:hypothetical protein BD324DRAFT_678850 [Kockovaella imperatae]ORX39748.1 hypothetical protein BD324DRAFT_678850 [Kockovaella imperatae]